MTRNRGAGTVLRSHKLLSPGTISLLLSSCVVHVRIFCRDGEDEILSSGQVSPTCKYTSLPRRTLVHDDP